MKDHPYTPCDFCGGITINTWVPGEFDDMGECDECGARCCEVCAIDIDWSSDNGSYLKCPDCGGGIEDEKDK